MSPDQIGFQTLLKKEVMRFWSVLGQTVTAPVITALLYLLVFAQAMQGRASAYEGVDYTQFLLPGLIMMAVIQNAFANTSSSLIQSKVMGNLVFLQMAPMFLLSSASLAVLGLIAGIVSQKFDHIAAFTNFFITPLSFLSGVFYSVHALPPFWYQASHLNPFFYMIDGFRYGFFGQADVPLLQSLLWSLGFFLVASTVCMWMLMTGYKLKK